MSTIEITTTITHRSLMNKSKSDLVDMVLMYADLNGALHEEIEQAVDAIEECKSNLFCSCGFTHTHTCGCKAADEQARNILAKYDKAVVRSHAK